MSDNRSNTTSSGIEFGGLLQVAFIVLKLIGVIDWSWWWVLSPTWISIAFVVLAFGIVFLVMWIMDR